MLGYPNEYGLLTDRPLLPTGGRPGRAAPPGRRHRARRPRPQRLLPRAADAAPGRGRVPRVHRRPPPGTRPVGRTRTGRRCSAAKMVGRWPSGAPLSLAPGARRPLARRQQRLRLPRRSTPAAWPARSGRTSGVPTRATRSSRSPAPRPRWPSTAGTGCCGAAAATAHRRGQECGVHFIVPQREPGPPVRVRPAHLGEQPGVQRARERDRPAGRAAPRQARATSPRRLVPARRRYAELPQFVHVRGGAYFFLPGIRALRFLASARSSTT